MKQTLLLLWCALAFALGTRAVENYPYRSDYLWVTVPNHADWLYQTGEQALIDVQFLKYGIPREGTVAWSVGGDLLPADKTGTAQLKNGRATINMGTSRQPGFRDLRLKLTLDGTTYEHHVKVGFSVDKIRPFTQQPKDFRAFWDKALDELKQFPMNYTIEPYLPYTTDKCETFLVKLQVDRRHWLYGYLMKPRGAKAGSCPVVLTPPGAGVKSIKQAFERTYFQDKGVIRLVTEIHGLNPTMTDKEFSEISSAFGNYLEMGLDRPDHFYMRHVYLGLVRCIDFLTQLPEWDGCNVAVLGGSQGGALSIVAAALDPRISLCVANHPALSDMAAGSAGLTSGYPHYNPEFYTKENVATMAYYDVVNFAPYVKARTYMTWGYNDNTCPPTTSYAVWNVLQCEKESLVTPINEHWTSDVTNRQQLTWLLQHFVK